MSTPTPRPPALVYRGDRYRLNFTAGTILTLLDSYGSQPVTEIFNVLDNQNKSAGIPGGPAGRQWSPPPPKAKGNYADTQLTKEGSPRKYKRTGPDPEAADPDDTNGTGNPVELDDDADVPALGLELPEDVERWPDTLREHCTYYVPTHDDLVLVLKMLDYCRLVDYTALDVAITDLGRKVVTDMRDAETMRRTIGEATGRLTPIQQYLVGDERDTTVGAYVIPFESLPLNITAATKMAHSLYSTGTQNPDDLFSKLSGAVYADAINTGIAEPANTIDLETGLAETDTDLPIRRNMQRQPSYRQFLWIMYNDRNTFTLAYGGVTEESTRLIGTKAQLADLDDTGNLELQRLKHARMIARKGRKYAELVLSGGPEAVWAGKPLNPKDVHSDITAFVAANRPGFVDSVALGSSLVWEAYDNWKLTMEDFERARSALHEGFGQGLVAKHTGTVHSVDVVEVGKSAVAESGSVPSGDLALAQKFVVRTADKVLQDMGIDIDVRTVTPRDGESLLDIMCQHTNVIRLKDGTEKLARCNAKTIGFTAYCEKHGGTYLDPLEVESLVKISQQKILAATTMATEVMIDVMLHSTQDAVKLRAAEQVLNRGGVHEAREININVDNGSGLEKTAAQIVSERISELQPSQKKKQAEIEPTDPYADDVIDAEVEETA